MRDVSFVLFPELWASAPPPFAYRFEAARPWSARWSVRDGLDREVGEARTRAGARAALRALYGETQGG